VAETLLPFWRRQMRTESCSDIPYCIAVATALRSGLHWRPYSSPAKGAGTKMFPDRFRGDMGAKTWRQTKISLPQMFAC
jgi:hypothetical protein